ncbi:hypothetical protein BH24ACT5_BH24ACT5_06960 [soil metagenome]
MPGFDADTQPLDPCRIDLDGPDTGSGVEEATSECASACTEVDDEFAWTKVETVDELFYELAVSEEVLPEFATSPVALGRSPPGHGASPSSS